MSTSNLMQTKRQLKDKMKENINQSAHKLESKEENVSIRENNFVKEETGEKENLGEEETLEGKTERSLVKSSSQKE